MANNDSKLEDVSEEAIGLYDDPLIFYKRWIGLLGRANFLKDNDNIQKAKNEIEKFQKLRPNIDEELQKDLSYRRRK